MEHHISHDTSDFYMVNNLKKFYHSFENGMVEPVTGKHHTPFTSYPIGTDYFSPDRSMSIARYPNEMYMKHLGKLSMCIPSIANLVYQHGCTNDTRDGEDKVHGGRRMDVGSCGQNFEGTYKGHAVPCDVYGMKPFKNIKDDHERASILQQLADIADGIQGLMNDIATEYYNEPPPFYDPERNKLFGIPLREALGGSQSLAENFSLQLKCIGPNKDMPLIGPRKEERTLSHIDHQNCDQFGFTQTGTLTFNFYDKYGYKWSLKYIVNGRDKAGVFMNKIREYESVRTRIKRQTQAVDTCFAKFVTFQMKQEGGHHYQENLKLSYKDWPELVIDKNLPWEWVNIGDAGNEHWMQRVVAPSIGVQDYFFAGAADVVHSIGFATQSTRKAVQMSFVASYFNGFHRFYYLGKRDEQEIMSDKHPAIKFHQIYEEVFKTSNIADSKSGNRLNPCGVKFKETFYPENDPERKTLSLVVDGIIGILEWINESVDDKREFHHSGIEKRCRECLQDFRKQGLSNLDFSKFHLMMAIQICCLAGIVVKGHKNLNNLVYPVKSLGAAKQLEHLDNDERETMQTRILQDFQLEAYGFNASEGHLCETSIERVCSIMDYYFFGMSQFRIGSDGRHLKRLFGDSQWVEFRELLVGSDEQK
jgi:hypothetical protein